VIAQLGLLRKNTFRALAYVFVGLTFMIVSTLFDSDAIPKLLGLLGGALVVISGIWWIGRRLLELSPN
jgi:hypothetical protein